MRARRLSLVGCFLLLSLFPGGESGRCQDSAPPTIALLPITVQGAPELSHLREGIRAMLTSRLAAATGVTVVNSAEIDRTLARVDRLTPEQLQDLGRKVHADYVVAGLLSPAGNGSNLELSVSVPGADHSMIRFAASAGRQGEVIEAVDQLVLDMAAQLFGKEKPEAVEDKAAGAASAPSSPFQTSHPEKPFLSPGQ